MENKKEEYYIYHYCLNENLAKDDPNYCDRAWVDEAHGGNNACTPQNWKFCPTCVAKGFPEIKTYTKGNKIRKEMITKLTGYEFKGRELSEERKNNLKETLRLYRERKVSDNEASI